MKEILIVDVTASHLRQSRDNLLADFIKFLREHRLRLTDLRGLVLIEGEGSFSETRQAAAILNTIHLVKKIPVLGIDKRKYKSDYQKMFKAIRKYFYQPPRRRLIKPIYSGAPHIT